MFVPGYKMIADKTLFVSIAVILFLIWKLKKQLFLF